MFIRKVSLVWEGPYPGHWSLFLLLTCFPPLPFLQPPTPCHLSTFSAPYASPLPFPLHFTVTIWSSALTAVSSPPFYPYLFPFLSVSPSSSTTPFTPYFTAHYPLPVPSFALPLPMQLSLSHQHPSSTSFSLPSSGLLTPAYNSLHLYQQNAGKYIWIPWFV